MPNDFASMKSIRRRHPQQKDRHAVDQQRPRKPVHHRGQHLVEVGFCVQVASEFNQRLAVVVALAVEELVEMLLNPFSTGSNSSAVTTIATINPDRTGARQRLCTTVRDSRDQREVHAARSPLRPAYTPCRA